MNWRVQLSVTIAGISRLIWTSPFHVDLSQDLHTNKKKIIIVYWERQGIVEKLSTLHTPLDACVTPMHDVLLCAHVT